MNTLKAEKRSLAVKAKKLRREGYVVGNVFGRELKDSIPVKMQKGDVAKLLKKDHKGSQVMLDVDGQSYDVLIKSIDVNPLTRMIESIEFQALVSNEMVHSVAEVLVANHDKVVEGIVQVEIPEIHYKALPSALVDHVSVDVSSMKIGDVVRVKDLDIFSNTDISIKNDPEAIVVAVMAVRNSAVADTAEETDSADNGEDK